MDSNQRASDMNKNLSEKNQITNLNLNGIIDENDKDIFQICDNFYKGKKYLAIKIPAKIENPNKVLDLLGGKDLIEKKVNKNYLKFLIFLSKVLKLIRNIKKNLLIL